MPKPRTADTRQVMADHVAEALPRAPQDERALTLVLLAAEEVVRRQMAPPGPSVACSLPASEDTDLALEDSAHALADLMDAASALMAGNPSLTHALAVVGGSFGEGDAVRSLYRSLVPRTRPEGPPNPPPGARLTGQEQQTLLLIASGATHGQAAKAMGLSPKTIERHVSNTYEKLGVRRAVPALLRARSLGFITPDRVERLWDADEDMAELYRAVDPVGYFCRSALVIGEASSEPVTALAAQSAVTLLALAAATRRQHCGDSNGPYPRGTLSAITRTSQARALPLDAPIESIRSIVMAPPQSARHGFTPGSLYAAHDLHPQFRLNRAAVSEITTSGQVIRTFAGGPGVATRLIGPVDLAFTEDGRLAATSGWLTDALLMFTAGGAHVERVHDGQVVAVTGAPNGTLLVANNHTQRAVVQVLAPDGEQLEFIAGQDWAQIEHLAVTGDGTLLIGAHSTPGRIILRFSLTGAPLGEIAITGHRYGRFTCDAEGNLYVPCPGDNHLRVLSPTGAVLRRAACGGGTIPQCVAVAPDGTAYVGGEACAP